MHLFRQILANNTSGHWVTALLAAAAFLLFMYGLRRGVLHHLRRMASDTKTLLDDFLVELLTVTRFLLAGAASLYIVSLFSGAAAQHGKNSRSHRSWTHAVAMWLLDDPGA